MTGRIALTAVRTEPLSVEECLRAVSAPGAGGLGLFIGVVRDIDDDRAVTHLHYEAHPSAEDALAAVCAEAALGVASGPVVAVAAVHRSGLLAVGDIAVIVAVSARHRAAALDTCHWLIDAVKSTVPIWKKQLFADGSSLWVDMEACADTD